MTGNRATAGATLEAIMSKQIADEPSNLVKLSDKELDSVTGGDSASPQLDAASPTLLKLCYSGQHIGSGKLH
jgi:bacteriocin-like protein